MASRRVKKQHSDRKLSDKELYLVRLLLNIFIIGNHYLLVRKLI